LAATEEQLDVALTDVVQPPRHEQGAVERLAIAGELPFCAGTTIEIVEDHPRQSAFGETPVLVDIHGLHHLYSWPPSLSTTATLDAALQPIAAPSLVFLGFRAGSERRHSRTTTVCRGVAARESL
jgi:hypothetical protein